MKPNPSIWCFFLAVAVSFGSCKDELIENKAPGLPIFGQVLVEQVSWYFASVRAGIINDGGSRVTEVGVVWSINPDPTVSLSTRVSMPVSAGVTIVGGNFVLNMQALLPDTRYYAKVYAINEIGIEYSSQLTFNTLTPGAPGGIVTYIVNKISSSSASGGGEIWGDGGSAITEKGIVWNTQPAPDTSLLTRSIHGSVDLGSFASELWGLTPSTTYYVRAYATNEIGTSYGPQQRFTTPSANLLTVTTLNVIVTVTSIVIPPPTGSGLPLRVVYADAYANIPDDGGSMVIERGFEYSRSSSMSGSSRTSDGMGAGGFYTVLTPLLTPEIRYYIRAYARNASGTAYGEIKSVVLPR